MERKRHTIFAKTRGARIPCETITHVPVLLQHQNVNQQSESFDKEDILDTAEYEMEDVEYDPTWHEIEASASKDASSSKKRTVRSHKQNKSILKTASSSMKRKEDSMPSFLRK